MEILTAPQFALEEGARRPGGGAAPREPLQHGPQDHRSSAAAAADGRRYSPIPSKSRPALGHRGPGTPLGTLEPLGAVKTKVHRKEEEAVDEQDRRYLLGNKAADFYAKEWASMHRPPPAELDSHAAAYDMLVRLLIGAGKLLETWPKSEDLWGPLEKLPSQPRTPQERPFVEEHHPMWDGKRYRCDTCLRIVFPMSRFSCKALPAGMRMVLDSHQRLHHSLHIGWLDNGFPLIFCNRCGGFCSERGSRKLLDPRGCQNKVTSELRKLRKGRVPGSHARILKVTPYRPSSLLGTTGA
ncbi:unnamed protein product [Prorocentrum cordatum]|uniref:C2H2-type domain-containing protein n=1 Tax=Prorocentrum cordatum TaxID=2364126 RepID=A0ABN9U2V9_9DINO|nr:unnamed protein product [Polarella glacialis]